MAWNAWRELRARPHITFARRDLPDGVHGVHVQRDGRTVVLLDRSLDRTARHAVLTHELIHDERGGGADYHGMPALWRPRVAIDELQVHRETALRIVPLAELAAFCDQQADLGHGVGPDEVMAEFECTRRVAEDALDNLTRHERGYR